MKARLGLEVAADAPLARNRSVIRRYVLASEFRLDLSCEAPASLDAVAKPPTKADELGVREIARGLRSAHADAYAAMADHVQDELGLKTAKLPAAALGSIDTFRFEERALLQHASDLVSSAKFDEALSLVDERKQSFWLDREIGRRAQWEATRLMAELGRAARAVASEVAGFQGDASAWVQRYAEHGGWHTLDMAQRKLETFVVYLDEPPEERPLRVVRRLHEDACQKMAVGFSRALATAQWNVKAFLHQTRIFSDVVAPTPKPVAYFLVDAMRFEMAVDLAEALSATAERNLRAVVGSLPSITPVGMAALQPGASSSFTVVEENEKLGARIDDAFLSDLAKRQKFAKSRLPSVVDIALDDVLGLTPSKLAKRIEAGDVIMVRSQEIDHAGEGHFGYQARQVMDNVIENLRRAIRKLAAAGIENAVVTADHGHLFFAEERDESMRIPSPGGSKVELHRRCWIGRGGATPVGCLRVSAAALGYASDLDFVFPEGCGVFLGGGNLDFHHGGISLQEMVIPVLTVRTKAKESSRPKSAAVTVSDTPDAVTNRIFSVKVAVGDRQLALGAGALQVRPLLMSGAQSVGAVGMVLDGELDRTSGTVRLDSTKPATVAFMVTDDTVASVRIVLLDPATDAELYRSSEIPVRLM